MYCSSCGARFGGPDRFCRGCGRARDPVAEVPPLETARALAAEGDLVGAARCIEAALDAAPDDRNLRLGLAAVRFRAGRWAEGLDAIAPLRASGRDAIVEAYAGGGLIGLGRVSEAKEALDRAAALAPDDAFVALKRGELFCRLGIYPTALGELERALRLGLDEESERAARRLVRFVGEKSKAGFVRRLVPRAPRHRRTGLGRRALVEAG